MSACHADVVGSIPIEAAILKFWIKDVYSKVKLVKSFLFYRNIIGSTPIARLILGIDKDKKHVL